MANEEHVHVALPKLYGAPAYARPPLLHQYTAEQPSSPDHKHYYKHDTDLWLEQKSV